MTGRHWSIDEIGRLRLICADWVSIGETLKAFPGKSRSSVRNVIGRCNFQLLGRPPTDDIPGEVWRPVPGWESLYEVSDRGRVRRKAGTTRTVRTRILKGRIINGYLIVRLRDGARSDEWLVNRLVLTTFVGPQPADKPHGAHYDGDRINNSLCNLRWATVSSNTADKIRHKRQMCGEGHMRAKLNREVVAKIRELAASGLSSRQIKTATGINVELGTIRCVVQKRTWVLDFDHGPGPRHA